MEVDALKVRERFETWSLFSSSSEVRKRGVPPKTKESRFGQVDYRESATLSVSSMCSNHTGVVFASFDLCSVAGYIYIERLCGSSDEAKDGRHGLFPPT